MRPFGLPSLLARLRCCTCAEQSYRRNCIDHAVFIGLWNPPQTRKTETALALSSSIEHNEVGAVGTATWIRTTINGFGDRDVAVTPSLHNAASGIQECWLSLSPGSSRASSTKTVELLATGSRSKARTLIASSKGSRPTIRRTGKVTIVYHSYRRVVKYYRYELRCRCSWRACCRRKTSPQQPCQSARRAYLRLSRVISGRLSRHMLNQMSCHTASKRMSAGGL